MKKFFLNAIGIFISAVIVLINLFIAFLIRDLPSKFSLTILMFTTLISVILLMLLWEEK